MGHIVVMVMVVLSVGACARSSGRDPGAAVAMDSPGQPSGGRDGGAEPGPRPSDGDAVPGSGGPPVVGPRPGMVAGPSMASGGCVAVGPEPEPECRVTPEGYVHQKLTAGESGLTGFGRSLSLHEDTLVVMTRDGVVFAFRREGQAFTRLPSFAIDRTAGRVEGLEVALTERFLVAFYARVTDLGTEGMIAIVERVPDGWVLSHEVPVGPLAYAGQTQLAVGNRTIAYLRDETAPIGVLQLRDGSWQQGSVAMEELARPVTAMAVGDGGLAVADSDGLVTWYEPEGQGEAQPLDVYGVATDDPWVGLAVHAGVLSGASAGGRLMRVSLSDHQPVAGGQGPCSVGHGVAAIDGDLFVTGGDGYAWMLRGALDGQVAATQLTSGGADSGRSFGQAVGVHAGTVAVGAPRDSDWGFMAGAVHVYMPSSGASAERTCRANQASSEVPGQGTACMREGSEPLACEALAASADNRVDIRGETPFGPLALTFGVLNQEGGFTSHTGLRFAAAPARADSRPALHVGRFGTAFEGDTVELEASLELCDQGVTVPATVTLLGPENSTGTIEGSLRIDVEGWSVEGTFFLAGTCRFTSTP